MQKYSDKRIVETLALKKYIHHFITFMHSTFVWELYSSDIGINRELDQHNVIIMGLGKWTLDIK